MTAGHATALLVIEAPGKRRAIARALRSAGVTADVHATGGHIRRHPGLYPLGITEQLEEIGRVWMPSAASLRRAARGREVVVATDPDAEGEVIARDVAECVGGDACAVTRMYLPALSPLAMQSAWRKRAPMTAKAAFEGDARRMLDRIIAHAYTQADFPVGRVISAALAVAVDQDVVVGRAVFVLDATDGGHPWRAEVPVTASTVDVWRSRVEAWTSWAQQLAGAARVAGSALLATRPPTYASLMLDEGTA